MSTGAEGYQAPEGSREHMYMYLYTCTYIGFLLWARGMAKYISCMYANESHLYFYCVHVLLQYNYVDYVQYIMHMVQKCEID